jgi:hypothetical protein
MLSRKVIVIASLSTIVCSGVAVADEGLKSSDFLTWSPENQRGFISTAAIAAGVIANLNRAGQARCIDDWGAKYREGGYQPVVEAMKKLPNYHPMAVTLTVIEKACGEFRYSTAKPASP